MNYINVVVENKGKHTDNFFTYTFNGFDVKPGDKVSVPFGSKDKDGFVFEYTDSCDLPKESIKNIKGVDKSGSLSDEIIKTCIWMKRRYAITYFDALHCFIPPGKPAKKGTEKRPYKDMAGCYVSPEKLTLEQENAVAQINNSIENDRQDIFLVHGVTASGKTQVYMEAIDKAISMNKTAIMLVPEISLTKQIIENFIGRFGNDNIAVLHSRLTQRERYDEWQRIKNGEAKIVIGARMGVFAPLENIGVIIMDEEHESTYKSDMTPKYDTVDVALKRLKFFDGVLILGSATPSVVSYRRAKEGLYHLINLRERYNKTPLPEIVIADMREELKEGNTSIFSRKLYDSISEVLDEKEQIILLQNRRGYSNFVSCRNCGTVMKCPSCGISLTYHKSTNSVICHYCGRKYPVPKECPQCGSRYMKYFGIGTEQVEETAKELFPNAVCARLDLDTVKKRSEMDRILNDFAKGKTDILIGTQLVAKGLDFRNVGLVGIIAADVTLNIPDYRSSEKTYQLITQVSGRAGRGEKQGLVVIQTYEPDNFAIQSAARNDYNRFYLNESQSREFLEYPPFGDIIMVNFTSEDEKLSLDCAKRCQNYMENILGADKKRILSPKISFNFKGTDSFRYYIIVKCPKGKRNEYVYYLDNFSRVLLDEKIKCNINIDVNPYSIV